MKRPKEDGSDIPALERLIGPVAYRGRPSYIDRKKGKSARPTGKIPGKPRAAHTIDLASVEFQPTLLFQKGTLKNHHLSQKEGLEIQEDHHLENR